MDKPLSMIKRFFLLFVMITNIQFISKGQEIFCPDGNLLEESKNICGTSYIINPVGMFASYLWSNGATTPSIQVNQSGTYILKAYPINSNDCIKTDTIKINFIDGISVGDANDLNIKLYKQLFTTHGENGLNDPFTPSSSIFGVEREVVGDVDGDGVEDIAVASYNENRDGRDKGGFWILFMNIDGTVKSHKFTSASHFNICAYGDAGPTCGGHPCNGQTNFASITSAGDVDGDGVPDIFLGNTGSYYSDNPCNTSEGVVIVSALLNRDGTIKSYNKLDLYNNWIGGTGIGGFGFNVGNGIPWEARFRAGATITKVGDLDGDGISEIAFSMAGDGKFFPQCVPYEYHCSSWHVRGYIHIVFPKFINGKCYFNTNQERRIHDIESPNNNAWANFAVRGLHGIGDMNNDGIPDLLASATEEFNGKAGRLHILFLDHDGSVKGHRTITNGLLGFPAGLIPNGAAFGTGVTEIGDIDNNNVKDIVVGSVENGNKTIYIISLQQDPNNNDNISVKHVQKFSPNSTLYYQGSFPDLNIIHIKEGNDIDRNGIKELLVYGKSQVDPNKYGFYTLFFNKNNQLCTPYPLPDTILCSQKTYNVDAGRGWKTRWSNGDTTQITSIQQSGNYWVERIGISQTVYRDSFNVILAPNINLKDTVVNTNIYQLTINDNYSSYLWSTGDTVNTTKICATGTYWVQIVTEAGCIFRDTIHVTINSSLQKWKWDFETGSQPFSSEYTFKNPTVGSMVPETTYGIGTSPSNYHQAFCNSVDHTTGTGNMMVVNGAINGNKRAWYATLAIKPYTKYTISFWSMSLVGQIGFGFFANNTPLGDALTYNAAEKCKWKKHTYQWYSDNLSSVTFSLRNVITAASGNDIAFDDIEIEELPQGINLGADVFASCSHLLDAGAGFASYLWSNQDTTRTTRIDTTGTYWVKATTVGGCIFTDTIHVTISQPIPTEIVWDFEGQDPLFGSDLTLVPPTPACTSSSNCSLHKTEEKYYAVASKMADYSHTWRCLTDHTKGGSGNFFFSNGDRTKTDKRWYANTAVQPYTEYEISFWMESINEGQLLVGVSMDNIPLGDTIKVASVRSPRTCQWKYYTFRWKSANQTQVELAIKSFAFSTTKSVGNDIALDDIRIRTVPYFTLGEDIKVNCGYKLDAGAGYTSYKWSNNATSQSIQIDSTGTYWVEVTTNNLCRFRDSIYVCITNQDTLIVPHNTYYIDSVLAVSATTFSDKWLNDLNQIDGLGQVILDTLFVGASFANGKEGVWRPQANYAYVTNRGQSSPITTKVDGTFRLKLFRWEYEGELYTPEWRKVSTMTQYNPYNYDVENVDILQRYSAALYGYNGKLSTAVGANASYNELAFEGFEEYNANVNVNASNLTKSNFDLFTTNAVGNVNVHRWIPLRTGIGNTIASLLQTKLNTGRVSIKGVFIDTLQNGTKTFFLENQKISKYKFSNQSCYSSATEPVCEVDSSGWTLITLDSIGTGFNYDFHQGRYWTGSIATDTLIQPESIVNANTVMISKTKAHTGKNSLKISADASFEQVRMDLEAGKEYVLGAWVSLEDARMLDFASTGVGIEMKIGNDLMSFQPKGEVIEGWQRIEGKFKVPTCGGKVHLSLKKGSNTVAYFDDMRLFPALGNMQSYVYDPQNYKLRAVLDNNNYATLYFYDAQGNLFLIKKETERGIQTIQESFSQQKINK